MTASEAKKRFKGLKIAILADGKVDMTEVNVLLDFIDEYIGCDKFIRLKQLLQDCLANGNITEDESKQIADEIDRSIRMLTIEDIGEKAIVYGVVVIIATMFLLKLVQL